MHPFIKRAAACVGVAAIAIAALYASEFAVRRHAANLAQDRTNCLDELYGALGFLDKIELCLANGHLTQDDLTTLAAFAKK